MNVNAALKEMAIDGLEDKLRSVSVQEGCALLFSSKSDIGNVALTRILVESLGYSEEFFEIIVSETAISVAPKFNNRNWTYRESVQITRYAAGGGGRMHIEGYTFMEAIQEGCKHLRQVTFDYVRPKVEESKLITKFAERYVR